MTWAEDKPSKRTLPYPVTPDGRHFVVRGRLWRCSNPRLPNVQRLALVQRLMTARRDVGKAKAAGGADLQMARAEVDAAKRALGERGPEWWADGTPDLNRHSVANTPYRRWFAKLGLLS